MNTTAALWAMIAALAALNERILEYLSRPLFDNVEPAKPYKWTLLYLSFATGAVIGWFSGLNGFAELLPASPLLARILTAFVVGCGSSLVHELVSPRKPQPEQPQLNLAPTPPRERLRIEVGGVNPYPDPTPAEIHAKAEVIAQEAAARLEPRP